MNNYTGRRVAKKKNTYLILKNFLFYSVIESTEANQDMT